MIVRAALRALAPGAALDAEAAGRSGISNGVLHFEHSIVSPARSSVT